MPYINDKILRGGLSCKNQTYQGGLQGFWGGQAIPGPTVIRPLVLWAYSLAYNRTNTTIPGLTKKWNKYAKHFHQPWLGRREFVYGSIERALQHNNNNCGDFVISISSITIKMLYYPVSCYCKPIRVVPGTTLRSSCLFHLV